MKSGGKILWLLIVLASLAVATIFLHASIQDFTSSTVVTTIATTTASLQEVRRGWSNTTAAEKLINSKTILLQVYFPSVILCSINQIRKSLFTVIYMF